jgi:hypothetical protein
MQAFFSCNSPLAYAKLNQSANFKKKKANHYFLPKKILQFSMESQKTPHLSFNNKCKAFWNVFDTPNLPNSVKISAVSGKNLHQKRKKVELKDHLSRCTENKNFNVKSNLPPILVNKQKSIFDSWEVYSDDD